MTKRSPVAKQIRYDGLTSLVSKTDIQAFHQAFATKAVGSRRLATITLSIIVASWGIGLITGGIGTGSVGQSIGGIVLLLVDAGSAWGMIALFRAIDSRSVRLWRFAADNGWVYAPQAGGGLHQGMIFQLGDSRRFTSTISSPSTADTIGFELGEYSYSTGSGKNRRTHWWTYCCVDLDRNVPHMVLDSRHNNLKLFGKDISSNLPTTFSKDQVLSLEGNFNDYFTLYAPKEYKRDALYVFTPDLMALLIDNSSTYDAEVIDNKVYFYVASGGQQSLLIKPPAMQQWLRIIDTVGTKVNQQTDYYADETIGNRAADIVGEKGRRLRRGVSWLSIIIVVIIVIFNVVDIIIKVNGKG